jgi:hypothetical protein
MDYAALKVELDTDPLGRGYAGMGDEEAANSLNANGRNVDRTEVTGGEIAASAVRAELAALTAAEQTYVRTLMSAGTIPLTANFKTEMAAIFPPGSETRTNLIALLKRPGSRGEELGFGRVTPSDVAIARALP